MDMLENLKNNTQAALPKNTASFIQKLAIFSALVVAAFSLNKAAAQTVKATPMPDSSTTKTAQFDYFKLKTVIDTLLGNNTERSLIIDDAKIKIKKSGSAYEITRDAILEKKIKITEQLNFSASAEGAFRASWALAAVDYVIVKDNGEVVKVTGTVQSTEFWRDYQPAITRFNQEFFPTEPDQKSEEYKRQLGAIKYKRYTLLQNELSKSLP